MGSKCYSTEKGFKILALNINNQEIENFYKQECTRNKSAFVENMLQYKKTYKIILLNIRFLGI